MPPPSKSSHRAAAAAPAAKPSRTRPRNERRAAAAADPGAGPSPAHRPDQRRGREGQAPAMPPPRRASPMPAGFGLSQLTAEEIAKMDPEYLYFLRHARFEDDDGYTFQDPSEGGGGDPPGAARHEQPFAGGSNGGARGADPAPVGEAPKPGSPRDGPVCLEGDSSVKDEAPSGSASPDDGVARKGGARSGEVPMEMDSPAPAAEPAWYDSIDMDEGYRNFFKRTIVLDDGQYVFKDDFVNYGLERSGDNSKAEADATDDVVAEADDTVDDDDEEEGAVEEEDEEEDTDEEEEEDTYEEDTDKEDEEEDDSDEEEEEDEEEAVPGEDRICMGETENDVEVKVEVGVGSDRPTVNALAYYGPAEKVEEEVETISLTWGDTSRKESVDEREKERVENNVGGGSDLPMVPDYGLEEPIQRVMKEEILEDEQPLNIQVPVAPKLKRKAESLNLEASSRMGHDAMPHGTLELQSSVWPAHINERPESEFKEKLMEVLLKPFNQEECDKLFALATKRTPIIKERRTRNSVSLYPWVHELGKSYFDSYPGCVWNLEDINFYLADQVESSNYPNRLALLRGLFFWLEHIGLDGQFQPWSDVHTKYRVIRYY
ncbi:hypothetical protein ACP4OV_004230 [Aristida adscensionis]